MNRQSLHMKRLLQEYVAVNQAIQNLDFHVIMRHVAVNNINYKLIREADLRRDSI